MEVPTCLVYSCTSYVGKIGNVKEAALRRESLATERIAAGFCRMRGMDYTIREPIRSVTPELSRREQIGRYQAFARGKHEAGPASGQRGCSLDTITLDKTRLKRETHSPICHEHVYTYACSTQRGGHLVCQCAAAARLRSRCEK